MSRIASNEAKTVFFCLFIVLCFVNQLSFAESCISTGHHPRASCSVKLNVIISKYTHLYVEPPAVQELNPITSEKVNKNSYSVDYLSILQSGVYVAKGKVQPTIKSNDDNLIIISSIYRESISNEVTIFTVMAP